MKGIFQRMFAVLSFAVLCLFAAQLWQDYNRPYLAYQKKFKALLAQKADDASEVAGFNFGIRQRWVAPLETADRCETCHLAVDDPRFADAPQPFRTHPDTAQHPFETFACTVCHGGQGEATSLAAAHGPAENWQNAVYQNNFMQYSCSECHGEQLGEIAPVLTAGRDQFEDLGCRGCHKIEGIARNAAGPPIWEMARRVRPDWLFRWLKSPGDYLPRTRMPDSKFSGQDAADIARFLLQEGAGARGMETTGSYDKGKRIFGESRCVSCHAIEGKGGGMAPDLGRIASKATLWWLLQVIDNPHKIWPETQMPIYGFSPDEVWDVATFLDEEYIDIELDEELVGEQTRQVAMADAEHGRQLVDRYGCIGCHPAMAGLPDRGEVGPELTAIGDVHISRLDFGGVSVSPDDRVVANWLYNKMRTPRLFGPDLKMPDFMLGDIQAEALTTYLLGLKKRTFPAEYILPLGEQPSRYAPQGQFGKIMEKYRCLACHKIEGWGGDMATDLTGEGSRVRESWLRRYMRTPYAIRPILKERMPRFKIRDAEIETLYAYFRTTLVDDRIEYRTEDAKKMALDDTAMIRKGRQIYDEKYACNACHQIRSKGGVIAPDLTEVDRRLRREYILHYLHDPKAFVKRSVEPVYKMTEAEIEALAAFLVNPKEID